jgi:hypothetical protein
MDLHCDMARTYALMSLERCKNNQSKSAKLEDGGRAKLRWSNCARSARQVTSNYEAGRLAVEC